MLFKSSLETLKINDEIFISEAPNCELIFIKFSISFGKLQTKK